MADAQEITSPADTSSAVKMIRMEEQRAKQLLDDVLEEYLCKDTRVMQCFSKYVEEISNQYTKHYGVIREIRDNFSADVGAIYAVSLVKKKSSSSKYRNLYLLNHHIIIIFNRTVNAQI